MCRHFQKDLTFEENHKWTIRGRVFTCSVVLLCVPVCLSFLGVCVRQLEHFLSFECQGTAIAQTTSLLLNCLQLFYLFIKNKKKGKIRYFQTVC